jgi:KEOPS complex subunit Pcc1
MEECAVRTVATACCSKSAAATSKRYPSSSVRHESSFVFEYDTESDATTVERSLAPEIGDIEGERTEAALSREGNVVQVDIEAADLVALRAGQNTWLSLVGVAERAAGDVSANDG